MIDAISLSPNHSGPRKNSISRITPHCIVGQMEVEGIGRYFNNKAIKASCNYGIGRDGRVIQIVDEANRSWCSSSSDNDNKAVTIECASEKTAPYAFNEAVYNKLIDLCADICKRNGKSRLIWIEDKETALKYNGPYMLLTVHRWFKNKECPGQWLYVRMGELADKVNAKLDSTGNMLVRVTVNKLNIRNQPNGDVVGSITDKGVYTITDVDNGWGRLKSGAGWIYLRYTAAV